MRPHGEQRRHRMTAIDMPAENGAKQSPARG